jgi:hypothetical protein
MSYLAGARIWLSGSFPAEALPAQQKAIARFVSEFAFRVFSLGGHILHGSHPSFVPILLRSARDCQRYCCAEI